MAASNNYTPAPLTIWTQNPTQVYIKNTQT